jgi:hypothetical protein
MALTDEDLRNRLAGLREVRTIVHGVVNRVVRLESSRVLVVSERTGHERPIPFRHIRQWRTTRANSRVVRALARAVGLPGA